jgi:hypothetical protein
MKVFFISIFLLVSFLGAAQQPAEITLAELTKFYKEYYLSSAVDSINWKSKGGCDPGSIPASLDQLAEKRINFFRQMNRLPLIKVTTSKKPEAQAAAFVISKNNALSHDIPSSWKCYSQAAADGAKNSCLGLPNFKYLPQTAFITGFISDPGDGNYFVGHRRWLLNSRATEFSIGATKNSLAIYCTNNLIQDTLKNTFIAYPWNGYVPYNLVFSKWSFSIPDGNEVDYSNIKLIVKNKKGKSLPLKYLKENQFFPDKTITWKVEGLFSEEDERRSENHLKDKGYVGEEFTVRIEGIIVNKKKANYEYKVRVTEL